MSSDIMMLKLIKEYVLHNQYATARQIAEHFIEHDFGLRREYNIGNISSLIKTYSKKPKNRWFNVEKTRKDGKQVYVVKE